MTLHPTSTVIVDIGVILTVQAAELLKTQISSFPAPCENSYSNVNSISPGGNWMASSCGYKSGQTLEIVSHKGKQWVLQFKDYVAARFLENGKVTMMGSLYPSHWTSDEAYLYFYSGLGFSGGGFCLTGIGVHGLFRIDLNNGYVSSILPPATGDDGYDIAFSPNGDKLFYNEGRPAILDLITGENIPIKVENQDHFATFAWLPDGSRLAYTTCQESQDFMMDEKSILHIFYLDTHQSKTILEVKNALLRIISLDGNEVLKIEDLDYQTRGNDSYLFFDTSSEQFITPTITPTR